MENARHMRLVSHPGDERQPTDDSHYLGLTVEDLDAAAELAEFHRLLAADLAPSSPLRGLILRCAAHWSRLGAIPRNGLGEAESRDRG